MYFVPAISNIRNNLGQGSVNEEHVRELCRTMLDEAKHLYLNSPLSRSDSPFNAAADTDALIESRFGNSQDDNEEDRVCIELVFLLYLVNCGITRLFIYLFHSENIISFSIACSKRNPF